MHRVILLRNIIINSYYYHTIIPYYYIPLFDSKVRIKRECVYNLQILRFEEFFFQRTP